MMPARDRGFALLITLWLLIPVSALLLTLTGAARSESQLAANLRDALVLQAAADGAIETVILSLLASNPAAPDRLAIGGATVAISIVPLAGLVNPNIAPLDLLRALLTRAGLPPGRADELAATMVEWRTPGPRGRDGRDKAARYRAEGIGYGPPGAPFETIGELRDVLGMPVDAVDALRPSLSLFTDRPPDLAIAPPLVRAALADLGARPRGDAGTVFRIVARAAVASGAAVTRSAVIRLAIGTAGRPWSVLAWESSDLAGQ